MVLSGWSASSTNKTGRHDIAEILLKVVLNTIKSNQINRYSNLLSFPFVALVWPIPFCPSLGK
jgi:hypothetical protein